MTASVFERLRAEHAEAPTRREPAPQVYNGFLTLASDTELATAPGAATVHGDDFSTANAFYRDIGKRILDLTLSFFMLPIILPVVAVLAVGVWAHDRGNPFFVHKRVGRGNRLFGCMKLRTMVVDAEIRLKELLDSDPEAAREWAETQKLDKDPRVTSLGRFLRKTSLDELPQLWNVIRGEMSLVGPRPVVPDELLRYGSAAANYARVRPGVTGPWQATGRNDLSYPERVRLDVKYEQRHSLLGDLKIIFQTATAVLNATGK